MNVFQIDGIAAIDIRDWLTKFGKIVDSDEDFFDNLNVDSHRDLVCESVRNAISKYRICFEQEITLGVYGDSCLNSNKQIRHTDVHLCINGRSSFIQVAQYAHGAVRSSLERRTLTVPLQPV